MCGLGTDESRLVLELGPGGLLPYYGSQRLNLIYLSLVGCGKLGYLGTVDSKFLFHEGKTAFQYAFRYLWQVVFTNRERTAQEFECRW